MKNRETFYWYDLETFGLNPKHDRIAQFAGIRTDSDLNFIDGEEPIVLYCKLSDDYLPDPGACLVTGITPQEVQAKGLAESQFINTINSILSVPRTCAVGYNSLRFDDEFLRNALFRNFHDPYKREWENGNTRWDILDLVRATHDLRPEGINWPRNTETGNPSFKLTSLTEANGISHEHAHDALSDVYATIEMARLIRDKQPKLFDYYLSLRQKQVVKDKLQVPMGDPVLLTAAQYTRNQGCTTLVVPITQTASNANSIIVFDLMEDPHTLLSMPDEKFFTVHGINRIALNRCPFVSPLTVLNEPIATRLGIDKEACFANLALLREEPLLPVRIRMASNQDDQAPAKDVDSSLYSGKFLSNADSSRFAKIRSTTPEELWNLNFNFDDSKYHELLRRYIFRNWPETLSPERKREWREFCAERLKKAPVDELLNLETYQKLIDDKLADKSTTARDSEILKQLDAWGKEVRQRVFSR